MIEDGLRLTAYIGERDHVGGRLLADALLDVYAIIDEMTHESGLVTSEIVPALRVAGPGIEHGGLELAARPGRSPG